MFYRNQSPCVNFTVYDISEYSRKLEDIAEKAKDRYEETAEWAKKICDALRKIIEQGKTNLESCMKEIALCTEEQRVVAEQLGALRDYEQQIQKAVYQCNECISRASAAYSAACSKAENVRNRTVRNEAEERARQSQMASAQAEVRRCEQERARWAAKRDKLQKISGDVGREMSKLEIIQSDLSQIDQQLRREKGKIIWGIETAGDLIESIDRCMKALMRAYEDNIELGLSDCCIKTKRALAYANEALERMSALNGKSYSSDERILVEDLTRMRYDAETFANQITALLNDFKEIYGICREYGELLEDEIMAAAQETVDHLAAEERHTLVEMKKKSYQLEEFCESLVSYSKVPEK